MDLLQTVEKFRTRALSLLERVRWLAPLLLRISLFAVFAPSGWGKIHDLDTPTKFFMDLGIPAPHFNAVLVSLTELVCGSLLLVGLFSRLAAGPLVISMIVAIWTAKKDKIEDLYDFLSVDEYLYIVMLLAIVLFGPGRASLDHFIDKWLRKRAAQPSTATSA